MMDKKWVMRKHERKEYSKDTSSTGSLLITSYLGIDAIGARFASPLVGDHGRTRRGGGGGGRGTGGRGAGTRRRVHHSSRGGVRGLMR